MGVLERGFKAWAENLSTAVRRDLAMSPHAPLPPACLAAYLDVRLWTPRDVPGIPRSVRDELLERDPEGWSAVSFSVNGLTVVIYNPRHSPARQNSDIAHELAHIILEHQPSKIVLSQDGAMVMRSFEQIQEEEANWLGWCLLLPRPALVHAMKGRLEVPDIAERWGVSERLVEFRLRITGVSTQFQRYRR